MEELISGANDGIPVEIPPVKVKELLNWIFANFPAEERNGMVGDTHAKLLRFATPAPLAIHSRGILVAACCGVILPGKVGLLVGIRATQGYEHYQVNLLKQFRDRFCRHGIHYQQIALPLPEDEVLADCLLKASWQRLTEITHLWRPVDPNLEMSLTGDDMTASFVHANSRSFEDVSAIVQRTFDGTLDCPKLNDLRPFSDVFQGFLNERSFEEPNLPWYLLMDEMDQPLGCLLLEPHDSGAVEIAYMGLHPAARGRRLGFALIAKTLSFARKTNAHLVVTAADVNNTPAMTIYQQAGFEEHRRLSVWAYSSEFETK
ncbi:MAG: GNAT family N-acetyltransferase [Planctomycetales bacterium]|nr:GNAT family N-acetyltransferase [Planctomycetales bacterium]